MATITQRHIIDEIIRGNGHYMDDPVVVKIVEYRNMFNREIAWGIIYQGEDLNRYHESPACIRPRTIWEHEVLKTSGESHGSW
jgi:hypothetical protein